MKQYITPTLAVIEITEQQFLAESETPQQVSSPTQVTVNPSNIKSTETWVD